MQQQHQRSHRGKCCSVKNTLLGASTLLLLAPYLNCNNACYNGDTGRRFVGGVVMVQSFSPTSPLTQPRMSLPSRSSSFTTHSTKQTGLVVKSDEMNIQSTNHLNTVNGMIFRRTNFQKQRSTSLVRMQMVKKDNNDNKNEKENNGDESKTSMIISKLPPEMVDFVKKLVAKFLNILPGLKIAVISATVGAVLTFVAIFAPIYDEIDATTESVTLFETILYDLDQRYVDKVDTQKLFETGVSAMLRSLDPYTEFEGKSDAEAMTETVSGRYAGVGLVISGATLRDGIDIPDDDLTDVAIGGESTNEGGSKLLPKDALNDQKRLNQKESLDDKTPVTRNDIDKDDLLAEDEKEERLNKRRAMARVKDQGIRVVSAFEGYAFDYGMRVGDKIVAIDGKPITDKTSVEDVRNMLRGTPQTTVDVTFLRDGVEGENTVSLPRQTVRIPDVKLAALVGDPKEGMGYISLTGFAANAGLEVRNSIIGLQRLAENASGGERSLQGLVLDLRGNPGGLLTSAVDVASLLVPKGSDIVSARGRGFPGVVYRSQVDPVLDPQTKLVVLVNSQTASAAEIVSGAVQDLDVGVIVGNERTFGKGLVQNVEDLPYNTALKYTVAKYYTPSGRCIQSTNYKEGGGLNAKDNGRYEAQKVKDKDKSVFYTKNGREVKDGGGVEADFKISPPKASLLEITLLRSGVYTDYAAEWSKKNELTSGFAIDDATFRDFKNFVMAKQKEGDIKLEAVYAEPIKDLKKVLKESGYKVSSKELDQLQANIIRDIQKDFDKYESDIKEDIGQNILARYLPERMLIQRGVKSDKQVNAALDLIKDGEKFDKILARTGNVREGIVGGSTFNTAAAGKLLDEDEFAAKFSLKW
uniref:PDZ domain-containing protein n=1 Tax=Ditylum brightwellii TaxID=49249 RepID=A0A7S1YXK9_9STRA|mmetsp:Transcript_19793/g.29506  ORF Transcript_19793/g.29506 Transcript_19793/m.29506 type:complete len:866 (+) Transcript_19793:151-2748(+)